MEAVLQLLEGSVWEGSLLLGKEMLVNLSNTLPRNIRSLVTPLDWMESPVDIGPAKDLIFLDSEVEAT